MSSIDSTANSPIGDMNIITDCALEYCLVNLNKYFNCGGFGDYVKNRKSLVKEAIISSQKKFNKKFDKNNIYLFGDTEKDVQSAIENNITPVLINHKNRFKDITKKISIKYYFNFSKIDSFLKSI